jgi:alkylation response protein AidB-like acyl-CoA dehydrogenase
MPQQVHVQFNLPVDQRAIFEQARQLAEERLSGRGERSAFDPAGWKAAAEFGVFRAAAISADGVQGAMKTVAILEGLGRGGADRGLLFAIGAHLFGCLVPISIYATPSQAAVWEHRLREGSVVGALAVTEAGGGSSLDHIETAAAETEGGYRLNGRKTLIGNAARAGLFIVLARQFPERGPLGLTAFLVPADTIGLSARPMATTIGLPGAAMGNIELNDCLVPRDAVLGKPGAGLRVFSTAMLWERSCLLAGFLGAAERDLAACIKALRARGSRGSLLQHQAVSHRLARMKLRLDGARLLGYRAAQHLDEERDDHSIAAMAKLAMSEAVVAVAEDALRLLAGMAWRKEPIDLSAALGDALGGLFASGTSELQLEMIARSLQAEHGE